MKFRKVELKNFRQFYGEQTILFSTDPKKNVTLIHAENGTGKTAFLNAILWCLFEIHTDNFKDPKQLVNKVSKSKGKYNFSVLIEFENDEGNIYSVQRSFGSRGLVFCVFEIKDNSYNVVTKPNSFINSVIPKDMAKYFFFQSEGIGKMSGSKGTSVVKTAVREILGFTIAEHALRDLQKVKKEYQRSLSNADKSGKISKLQDEIIHIEELLESNTKQLSKLTKSISLYNQNLIDLEELIANSDNKVIKQIHSRRISAEMHLKKEQRRLSDAQKEKRNLISEFATTVFGYELSLTAIDFIDEDEYIGTVPAPYNEQLVTDILKEKICICGSDIHPGSEAFSRIEEMLKKASDPMLENRIKKSRSQLNFIKNDSLRAKGRFNNNIKILADTESSITQLQSEIQELSIQIQGAETIENITKLENERNRAKNNLIQDERASAKIEQLMNTDIPRLSSLKLELGRLDAFSSEMEKYRGLVSHAATIEEVLETTLKTSEEGVELKIIEKVNNYLKKFVRQDYKAKLNPVTFNIRLIDKNGHIVPESDGQALLLGLTFIASLIELSRERKNATGQILTSGAIAPFVIDAPFGELDNKYKGDISKAIPDSVEQVIFLLSSSHWSGSVENNIRDRIGSEYNMVLEETSKANGKSDDFIEILGTKYETVRYETSVDRTVLEKVGSYV